MMDHLLPGVESLVELEHKTIVDKYGPGYNSMHEGYAVLLEEVEEAAEALHRAQEWLSRVWNQVRNDNKPGYVSNAMRVEHAAKELAAEAVQIAAVARRWRGGLHNDA